MSGPVQAEVLETLGDVGMLACQAVVGCDAAGVIVRLAGSEPVMASAGSGAEVIDGCQYSLGDGPCLVTMRDGVVVEVDDYASDTRWPKVGEVALEVGMHSSLSLPLRDDARVFGALNLYGTRSGSFRGGTHRVASALGRQAAAAVRSLELLQAERERRRSEQHIAETLQQSLLSAVPELPDIDCATRYLPASNRAQVGGDFYDAFPLPDGAVGIAIGDVMGKDVAAAAAMGQLRSVLRSYAYEGINPSAVLDRLDRLVQQFDMAREATALYGRLIHDWDGALFLFCNAGHLPPLVRLPDGPTRWLAGGTSRQIGSPPPTLRSEAAVVLPRGSTLLLYTDGLVERHDRDRDEGLALLEETVAAAPDGCAPEQLCDHVLERLIDGEHEDDVALLALRIS